MIISFLIGMAGLVLVNYSILKMKDILNYKNQGKFKRFFGGANTDAKAIFKFFNEFIRTKDSNLKRRYFEVAILFIFGFLIFIGTIVYIVIYE